jgi:hypothetical protein
MKMSYRIQCKNKQGKPLKYRANNFMRAVEIAARCKSKGYKFIEVWELEPTTELIDVQG